MILTHLVVFSFFDGASADVAAYNTFNGVVMARTHNRIVQPVYQTPPTEITGITQMNPDSIINETYEIT